MYLLVVNKKIIITFFWQFFFLAYMFLISLEHFEIFFQFFFVIYQMFLIQHFWSDVKKLG